MVAESARHPGRPIPRPTPARCHGHCSEWPGPSNLLAMPAQSPKHRTKIAPRHHHTSRSTEIKHACPTLFRDSSCFSWPPYLHLPSMIDNGHRIVYNRTLFARLCPESEWKPLDLRLAQQGSHSHSRLSEVFRQGPIHNPRANALWQLKPTRAR